MRSTVTRGPNTGGMGAFCPVEGFALGEPHVEALRETVILPVLRELARRGTPFRGLLYAGIVDTAAGPKVLEYNVRFGDPETQVVTAPPDIEPRRPAVGVGRRLARERRRGRVGAGALLRGRRRHRRARLRRLSRDVVAR